MHLLRNQPVADLSRPNDLCDNGCAWQSHVELLWMLSWPFVSSIVERVATQREFCRLQQIQVLTIYWTIFVKCLFPAVHALLATFGAVRSRQFQPLVWISLTCRQMAVWELRASERVNRPGSRRSSPVSSPPVLPLSSWLGRFGAVDSATLCGGQHQERDSTSATSATNKKKAWQASLSLLAS